MLVGRGRERWPWNALTFTALAFAALHRHHLSRAVCARAPDPIANERTPLPLAPASTASAAREDVGARAAAAASRVCGLEAKEREKKRGGMEISRQRLRDFLVRGEEERAATGRRGGAQVCIGVEGFYRVARLEVWWRGLLASIRLCSEKKSDLIPKKFIHTEKAFFLLW